MSFVTGGIIEAVGSMSILYRYGVIEAPMYPAGGKPVALGGFKLNAEFLSTSQTTPNSVIIPLLGGGSVQLTNDNKSGSLSFAVTRTANTANTGTGLSTDSLGLDSNGDPISIPTGSGAPNTLGADIVQLALDQISIQGIDSQGATITASTSFNGVDFTINFEGCTVVTCEPIRLAGNDVPTYSVVFNYHRWNKIT